MSASLEAASAKGALRRIGRKVFGRHLLNVAILAGICLGMMGPVRHPTELIQDPDVWWHLADARILFTTHHFIRIDPYSFTLAGQPWVNPEWLGEVPYWLGYAWRGMLGVHLLAAAVLCANLIFVYFRSYWKSRHISAAFWTAVLGFFQISINAGARTIGIAYLALSAEMAILEAAEKGGTRWLWLLPPLFCVWINLHGSWIIGLAFFAVYGLCGMVRLKAGVFNQEAFSRGERNRLFLVFLASVAALLVNPYGWRLIWNPFDMLLNQHLMLGTMVEWEPLNLGTTTGMAAAVAIVLMIVANCVRGRTWKVYELAFILFAWYYAFAHQRFAFLACIVTMPWLTADVARSFMAAPDEKTIPALNALIAVGIVCLFAYLFPSESMLEQDFAAARPLRTIASIQPAWRTFDDYALGGIMDFYSKPVFSDSRNDLFVHSGVYKDFLDIENLRAPQALLDKYRVDHALIRADSALALVLSRSPEWRVEMREGSGDNAFVMFARNPVAGSGKVAPAALAASQP